MISFSWVPPDFIAVGKKQNCFKTLHVDLLTFSLLETKSFIFCSVLDSALRYLSSKQGNPNWTTDLSAWAEHRGGLWAADQDWRGTVSLMCLCLLQLATGRTSMGSINTQLSSMYRNRPLPSCFLHLQPLLEFC